MQFNYVIQYVFMPIILTVFITHALLFFIFKRSDHLKNSKNDTLKEKRLSQVHPTFVIYGLLQAV